MAHQLIPHDHHSSDLYGLKEDLCPVTEEENTHHHGLPAHCHAFNELTVEEIVKVTPATHAISADLTLPVSSEMPYFQVYLINITDHHTLSETVPYHKINSFRAPPVIS